MNHFKRLIVLAIFYALTSSVSHAGPMSWGKFKNKYKPAKPEVIIAKIEQVENRLKTATRSNWRARYTNELKQLRLYLKFKPEQEKIHYVKEETRPLLRKKESMERKMRTLDQDLRKFGIKEQQIKDEIQRMDKKIKEIEAKMEEISNNAEDSKKAEMTLKEIKDALKQDTKVNVKLAGELRHIQKQQGQTQAEKQQKENAIKAIDAQITKINSYFPSVKLR